MTLESFTAEMKARLSRMREQPRPPDLDWPEGCYGSAQSILLLVGPSPGGTASPEHQPGERDASGGHALWNEPFSEPYDAPPTGWGRKYVYSIPSYQQLAATAKVLGVKTQHVDIRGSADLDAAFGAVVSQRAQALLVYPLPITPADSQKLVEFAVKNRLPAATPHQPYVRAGLLLSYVTDVGKQFRRAGIYVDRILKGAKPGGPACRAARQVRPDDQSQDREGAGAPDATVSARASR